jgi:hypothetical protein
VEGQHAQTLFEAAILPALSGFVLCLGFVVIGGLRPVGRPGPWSPLTRERRLLLVRSVARLALFGSVVFAAIVLCYSVLLQHEPRAESAAWGGLFLLGVAAVAWIALTAMVDRRSRDVQTLSGPSNTGPSQSSRSGNGSGGSGSWAKSKL